MSGWTKATKNYHSNELNTTLKFKYGSSYIKKKNPGLSYENLYSGIHNVKQDSVLIKNGKRKLLVRTFDDPKGDKMVKKTRIHKKPNGKYIMNVKNKDVKDYNLLVSIIDRALRIK